MMEGEGTLSMAVYKFIETNIGKHSLDEIEDAAEGEVFQTVGEYQQDQWLKERKSNAAS